MMDVAIVGIGCRLPGKVHGPDQLWEFLLAHGDGIIEVPADRWSLDRYYDPDPDMPGRMYTRSGGFLQGSLWDFDPEFFGISPREASTMDPQQRLLLEVTQEAMDDAGLPGRVAGRPVGVYVGAFTVDNMVLRQRAHEPVDGGFPNRHGGHVHHAVQPDLFRVRPARAKHDHRHRLLVLVGRTARSYPGDRPRRDRAGPGRRGERDAHSRDVHHDVQGPVPRRGRPLQDLRRSRGRLRPR